MFHHVHANVRLALRVQRTQILRSVLILAFILIVPFAAVSATKVEI
jgi:hypothetical protein